jgi:hypothetical protein
MSAQKQAHAFASSLWPFICPFEQEKRLITVVIMHKLFAFTPKNVG